MHGRDCTLVDLDLVATGDPALDPGNFIAHLRELAWRNRLDDATALTCIDAFTAEAIRLAPHAVTHDAITRYELLSLGRLIEIAARHADRAKFVAQHLETLAERVSLFTPPVACTPTGGVSHGQPTDSTRGHCCLMAAQCRSHARAARQRASRVDGFSAGASRVPLPVAQFRHAFAHR